MIKAAGTKTQLELFLKILLYFMRNYATFVVRLVTKKTFYAVTCVVKVIIFTVCLLLT